jgi:hypothetical protein
MCDNVINGTNPNSWRSNNKAIRHFASMKEASDYIRTKQV